jgi:hypothetical protein
MSAFGGHGPDQGIQQQQGNEYLKQFPLLDYITSCAVHGEVRPVSPPPLSRSACACAPPPRVPGRT